MNKHSVCIAAICIMLISGCATQSLHNTQFVMWEEKDNIHTFDKSTAINARFLATKSDNAKITVIHDGKEYEPRFIEMVNSHSNIARYAVRIPGSFMPGEEVLQVQASFGQFTSMDELRVRIHPSHLQKVKTEDGQEISMEEEIIGLIKSLSKGDAIEFTAIPSSGLTIPFHQFRTFIEGAANKSPALGLTISSYDGYEIPLESDTVSVRVVWIDPNDQTNAVQIFPSDGSDAVKTNPGLKRPRIAAAAAKRINVLDKAQFEVITEIKSPSYPNMEINVADVVIEVVEQNIKGYRIVEASSVKYQEGIFSKTFELQGKYPFPDKISGNVKIRVKALSKSPNSEKSPHSTRTFKLPLIY